MCLPDVQDKDICTMDKLSMAPDEINRSTETSVKALLGGVVEWFPDIMLIILFGSTVTGRLRSDSDIDIAIAGDHPFSWDRLQEICTTLSRKLHREVDIVDLNTSKGMIMYQALTKGRVIVSKNRLLLARLMTDAVYFAADMMPLITMVFKLRARRFFDGRSDR
jgi:predicted nucleotidyltransferase